MCWVTSLGTVLLGLGLASAVPSPQNSDSPSTLTISTAVATASNPSASLPPQIPLPPTQAWCPSEIFCPGSLLQTVNLAELYPDSKTFVDKPTSKAPSQVLTDFSAINGSSLTEGAVEQFVDSDFSGEGLELETVAFANYNPTPAFLDGVHDPLVKAWSGIVHGYWVQLARSTNDSALCDGIKCESSLIPLNHTFVVPGGRFREIYYWDSFWIIEGLIQSELYSLVNSTLQNFMDQLETFGFIPNGGRIYYLNRSQPPLFIHMLDRYIKSTNDTSILQRALPLAELELRWWATNRSISVTSSYSSQTYNMFHYAVNNSAPRPESYLDDYQTATGANLTEQQRSDLYAELATGAESGWDYTGRWLKDPLAGNNLTDQASKLRTLNIRSTIPVDLNSLLYKSNQILADYLDQAGSTDQATTYRNTASQLRSGILDLFWDSNKLAFYDYNLTSNARNSFYSPAAFYPFWVGIIPPDVLNDQSKAFGTFASVNLVLNRYNGTYPSSFVDTGLQWDLPNSWPPHQYIVLQALQNLPSNLTTNVIPNGQSFDFVPSGQLGVTESQLPSQPIRGGTTNETRGDISKLNGTVVNGGPAVGGQGWGQTLQKELANRYTAAAFCSWWATGGSIPNVLPRRSDQELNLTGSLNNTGNMFEKFSNLDIDSAGSGGEYTVQAGFGWTNGVVLWVAGTYGSILEAPKCPNITSDADSSQNNSNGNMSGAVSGVRVGLGSVIGAVVLAVVVGGELF